MKIRWHTHTRTHACRARVVRARRARYARARDSVCTSTAILHQHCNRDLAWGMHQHSCERSRIDTARIPPSHRDASREHAREHAREHHAWTAVKRAVVVQKGLRAWVCDDVRDHANRARLRASSLTFAASPYGESESTEARPTKPSYLTVDKVVARTLTISYFSLSPATRSPRCTSSAKGWFPRGSCPRRGTRIATRGPSRTHRASTRQ